MNFQSFIESLPSSSQDEQLASADVLAFRLFYEDVYFEAILFPLDPSRSPLLRSAPVSLSDADANTSIKTRLETVLTFNRSASALCNASFIGLPQEENQVRLSWNPTLAEQSRTQWLKQMRNLALIWKKYQGVDPQRKEALDYRHMIRM